MAISLATLALTKRYVDETTVGLGAVKGAPCTIKSISETDNGSLITFEWTGTDGTKQTAKLNVIDGADGAPGKQGEPGKNGSPGKNGNNGSSVTNVKIQKVGSEEHLICDITDYTGKIISKDAGKMPVAKAEIATRNKAGIVKIGDNLNIDSNGVLSAEKSSLSQSNQKPTAGGTLGEVVFNASPAPNGFVGWVYTAYGWLGFGAIEDASGGEIIEENSFILQDGSQFLVNDGFGNGNPFIYKEEPNNDLQDNSFLLNDGSQFLVRDENGNAIPFLYYSSEIINDTSFLLKDGSQFLINDGTGEGVPFFCN